MKIYTNAPESVIWAALRESGADFDRFELFRPTDGRNGFDVTLTGDSPRMPNGGRSGWSAGDDHAASWDQWGVFLAAIFRADPDARMGGTAKRPGYANAEDYHWQTCNRFRDGRPGTYHPNHHWAYHPADKVERISHAYCSSVTCSAQKRYRW
jgi:hypothetical protein